MGEGEDEENYFIIFGQIRQGINRNMIILLKVFV